MIAKTILSAIVFVNVVVTAVLSATQLVLPETPRRCFDRFIKSKEFCRRFSDGGIQYFVETFRDFTKIALMGSSKLSLGNVTKVTVSILWCTQLYSPPALLEVFVPLTRLNFCPWEDRPDLPQ